MRSVFGLYKPNFWWRRRDSNLRREAYEFSVAGVAAVRHHSIFRVQTPKKPTCEQSRLRANRGDCWVSGCSVDARSKIVTRAEAAAMTIGASSSMPEPA